jgi:hypothetical protein
MGSEAETHLPRETSAETDSHYPAEPSQSQEEQPQSNRQLRQEIQDPNQGRSLPTHFNVDIALDRRLRKGRGTRSIKFHEEFGYETLLTESVVMGEILALPTLVDESNAFSVMRATHQIQTPCTFTKQCDKRMPENL